MLKLKNDEKKKKVLEKPKQKRQLRSRYTVFLTMLIIVIFIIIVLIIRSPIHEMLVITPTVAARLATITPDSTVSGPFDATALDLYAQASPALPLIAVTNSPMPFNIGITLLSGADLRAGPGSNFGVIEHLNSGDKLALIGANNDYSWYLVGFRQQPIWIDASVLGQSVESLRQLPVVAVTIVPVLDSTKTFSPKYLTEYECAVHAPCPANAGARDPMTATPVVARAATAIPVYTGPGLSFGTNTTIPMQSNFQLLGVSEDYQWYLVKPFSNNPNEQSLQVWVQVSAVGRFAVSFLPVIRLVDGPGYVTLIPLPSQTPTPTKTPIPRGT